MSFTDPYLEAIQVVPGDTPNEKFRWIATTIKNHAQAGDVPREVENWKEIPQPLVSLVNVEAAKVFKTYSAVTEALKSKDNFVVTKALQANWYFDGSNKDITNVNYFFENIFPYVSLKTRIRIVRSLSRNLVRKEPKLAEEFFLALSDTYGIDHMVIRMLEACSESFAYDAIVKHRITLPISVLKSMYSNTPNLVTRYLKMKFNGNCSLYYEYVDFMPTLIKKNLDVFIEIFSRVPFSITLSKNHSMLFLKNAKEEFEKNPKLFIPILPLKFINTNLLESIFIKLFPEDIQKFKTDDMFKYLEYYPENKKVSLLFKSYKDMYDKNLLDNIKNITPNLLKILPEEQRVEQARLLLMDKQSNNKYNNDYTFAWRCYLPVHEAINTIQKDINTAKQEDDRVMLIEQMIYTCKINDDDDALDRVLKYCSNRHKNEKSGFWGKVLQRLGQIYDMKKFNEKHWNVIDDIIIRNYVTDRLSYYYRYSYRPQIEKSLLYKLKNNLPFDKLMEIFADLECEQYENTWSIQRDYPEYELKCFEAVLDIMKIKLESNKNKLPRSKISIVSSILDEIYDYNTRHAKPETGRNKLSLKNYPWLMQKVQSIVLNNSKERVEYDVSRIKHILQTNEEDIYYAWFPKEDKIENFDFNQAFYKLKKNPQNILDRYKKYLDTYSHLYTYSSVRRFLLACRWYKDIPIKFANEAVKRLQADKESTYFCFLGILLHGDTFTKLVEPYIPTEKTIDVKNKDAAVNYTTLSNALTGMLFSNPPVPIERIATLYEGDYLALALRVITNICNRTSILNVKIFANSLTQKRVSVRKHGIRVMCTVQPLQESLNFLLSQWKTENHHSVREIIFKNISKLFKKEPRPVTWSAFKECLSTLTFKDWHIVNDNTVQLHNIPTEYGLDFIRLILQIIDNFVKQGLEKEETIRCLASYFRKIDDNIANVLPDDFCEEIIEKYLFDPDYVTERFATDFLLQKYLFLKKDKIESRMATLARILASVIKNRWNMPHPQREHFYPVNYTVHCIMYNIASAFLSSKDKNPIIIYRALNFYDDFLLPEMDITNYFLLILIKEYMESSTINEFARKLGQKIPDLIEKHTPHYPNCFISSLENFLQIMRNDNIEEIQLTIRETLLECSTHYAHLVAVSNLPTIRNPVNVPKYAALIKRLQNHDNPAIKSIFYSQINSGNFNGCSVNI